MMRKVNFGADGRIADAETGEAIGQSTPDGALLFDNKLLGKQDGKTDETPSPRQVAPAPASTCVPAVDSPTSSTAQPVPDAAGQKSPPLVMPPSPAPSVTGMPLPKSYTKYEVRPDTEFTIRFCLGFDNGLVQVYRAEAADKVSGLERHWVRFRLWTYNEELSWKSRCMQPDPQTRSLTLDSDRLNELKFRNLAKDWSFGESDPKLKLLHAGGILSDESYDLFRGLFPNIANNILYLMNKVLEGNG